ncbi:MAG: response regulator [Acidobacteria bacterium]|nr:response regulator [Acidobacteriota bacterium]
METEDTVNILLVDDDPTKRLVLRTILADLRQNLVEVHSGKEALRALLNQDFAVVLLDVRMPVMDGFETAAMMRQREKSAHLPIIFVTAGDHSDTHVSRGYSLGAVDYIYTPIVPEILRAKVAVFVELKRQGERLRRLELREHERKLSEARDRLEAEAKRNRFFTLSLDLLCIAGFDGYFKQLSPSWEITLGLTPEELKARPFLEFVHPEDREATRNETSKLVDGSCTVSFENRYRSKDGSYRWMLWTAAPYRQEQLIYGAAHDITERKQAERALADRESMLAAAYREMETFSYSVSHDLRAPLRSIDGFSQALQEDCADKLDESGRHYLERIRAAAQHMGQLIDDLLHLSRVTRQELRMEAVDLSALAQKIALELREREPGRRVEMAVAEQVKGAGDSHLLTAVLENLLGNAWKFTGKKDEAKIEFGMRADGGRPVYFVRDNGAGFDMKYADKLFGAFQRLHAASDFPGTGVGLATVQRVVQRHGGKVWAESAVGQGATIYFTLGEGGRNGEQADPAGGG